MLADGVWRSGAHGESAARRVKELRSEYRNLCSSRNQQIYRRYPEVMRGGSDPRGNRPCWMLATGITLPNPISPWAIEAFFSVHGLVELVAQGQLKDEFYVLYDCDTPVRMLRNNEYGGEPDDVEHVVVEYGGGTLDCYCLAEEPRFEESAVLFRAES
jgi:hypothetical protein